MLSLSVEPQASRKFVDLILEATSKWANWDPGNMIKVGDFGEVNTETGDLNVKGNIYVSDTNIYQDRDATVREMVKNNPPIVGAREDDYYANSRNARNVDLKMDNHDSVPGLAEASIKGQWSFNSRRGAVVIMAHPKSCYIPPNTFLEYLSKVEALKGMYLVTQVFTSPTFSLYLSNNKNDVVSLALLGSSPTPNSPGATSAWWSSNTAGIFRHGHATDGNNHYAPLFTLQIIRGKPLSRRGVPDPVYTGDDLWAVTESPWELLDDDGAEEDSYDSE